MAIKGKISDLYDLEAIKAQQAQVVGYVDAFVRKVSETKPIKVQLEGAEKTKDLLKGMTDLGLATKEYGKIVDSTAVAQAKLSALQSDAAKKAAEARLQVQQQNKALNDQAKEAAGLIGPYEKLTAQYNAAAKEALNLAAQYGAQSTQAKEASARALELDGRLKAADANVGRFNKNVGNYSGAIKVLESALGDVKKKMDDMAASGKQDDAVMQTLEKELGLLQTLVDAQSNGFKNATSEIRNNQQAILLLSQIYGEDSAVVQELIGKTAKLSDTVSDMKQEIKARASDTNVFDGLISAANGLAGAYGIAQGATAILGTDNEDLQKTMVKLQAAMSILQGLQGIQNLLQKESAARQLVTATIQKVLTLQTNLQSAAESKSVIVRYAAVAAQKALNFAMSAAGGPILAVLGVIGLLLTSFTAFGATTHEAALDLKKFNEEIELGAKFAEQAQKEASQRNALAISESKKKFEAEQNARDLEKKGLEDQLAIQEKYIKDHQADEEKAVKYQAEQKRKGRADDADEFNKVGETLLKVVDARRKAADLRNQIAIKENENARANAVEGAQVRRAELELTVADLNTRADALKRVASDETKSYADRIKASNGYYAEQVRIVELQKKQALDNPELKPEERLKIENDTTNKEIVLLRDRAKAKLDLQRESDDRERQARLTIAKTALEDQVKADELITDNEKKSFDARLAAAYDSYNKRQLLLAAQYNVDIKNDKLTNAERLALAAKFTSDVNQVTVDYGLKQLELYKVNQEQITALLEKEAEKRKNIIGINQSDAIVALNNEFQQGKISIEKYNQNRAEIERKYNVQSLQEDVRNAFAKVMATKDGTTARYEAEKELADKTQALSDAVTQHQIDNEKELTDLRKQAAQEAFNTITGIIDAQYDNQKNKIQKQIDDVDKAKEADIAAVNATTASEQDKANKIAIINAKAAAQKEALERKQRQQDIERAKFDKAVNIAQIIAETAAAVMHQLKSGDPYTATGRAIAAGLIGAAQLAKAIATPIPQFAEGTDDAPGGPAWVGDGGRHEMVVTPQGTLFVTPRTPTLMNIPKHSVVLPDAAALMDCAVNATHANMLAATARGQQQIDIGQLVAREFEKNTNRLAAIILAKKETHFHWSNGELRKSVKNGNQINKYLSDNLDF